jgi:hypothetical protein
MEVCHHDDAHAARLDAALAQLCGQRLAWVHLEPLECELVDAPEALARADGYGGMEPGVDQHRPGAGVLEQERDDRDRHPLRARNAEAERAAPGEPALLAQEVGRRRHGAAAEQRMESDRRLLAPAGERELGRARLRGGGHGGTLERRALG